MHVFYFFEKLIYATFSVIIHALLFSNSRISSRIFFFSTRILEPKTQALCSKSKRKKKTITQIYINVSYER